MYRPFHIGEDVRKISEMSTTEAAMALVFIAICFWVSLQLRLIRAKRPPHRTLLQKLFSYIINLCFSVTLLYLFSWSSTVYFIVVAVIVGYEYCTRINPASSQLSLYLRDGAFYGGVISALFVTVYLLS